MKQFKIKRYLSMLLVVLFITALFTGCNDSKADIRIVTPLSDEELFKLDDEICSLSEAMILITAQKKVVEDVYGTEIWEVETEGVTFEETMKSSLKDFLARMKCMTLMAAEQNISLTENEKTQIKSCTEAYYSQLTEEEKTSMNISEEDVSNMFTSYYFYNKLMDAATSDMETEISDNDARIMQTEYIFVAKNDSDQSAKLQQILSEAKQAENFSSVAEKYNGNSNITMSISRNQFSQELEDVIFNMANGQISDVLETAEGYYIFHCINDYDREATAQHKAELIEAQKEAKFKEEYNNFVDGLTSQFNDKVWKNISLSELPSVSQADFFAIYEENVQ